MERLVCNEIFLLILLLLLRLLLLLSFLFALSPLKLEKQRVTALLKDSRYAVEQWTRDIGNLQKDDGGSSESFKVSPSMAPGAECQVGKVQLFSHRLRRRIRIPNGSPLPDLCPSGLNYPKRICYLTFSTHVSSALIEINPTLRLRSQC